MVLRGLTRGHWAFIALRNHWLTGTWIQFKLYTHSENLPGRLSRLNWAQDGTGIGRSKVIGMRGRRYGIYRRGTCSFAGFNAQINPKEGSTPSTNNTHTTKIEYIHAPSTRPASSSNLCSTHTHTTPNIHPVSPALCSTPGMFICPFLRPRSGKTAPWRVALPRRATSPRTSSLRLARASPARQPRRRPRRCGASGGPRERPPS